jgi:hypothetical protein
MFLFDKLELALIVLDLSEIEEVNLLSSFGELWEFLDLEFDLREFKGDESSDWRSNRLFSGIFCIFVDFPP